MRSLGWLAFFSRLIGSSNDHLCSYFEHLDFAAFLHVLVLGGRERIVSREIETQSSQSTDSAEPVRQGALPTYQYPDQKSKWNHRRTALKVCVRIVTKVCESQFHCRQIRGLTPNHRGNDVVVLTGNHAVRVSFAIFRPISSFAIREACRCSLCIRRPRHFFSQ